MTQKEFEDRIGFEVSLEIYKEANEIFMVSDLDEAEFCDQWKAMVLNPVFRDLILDCHIYRNSTPEKALDIIEGLAQIHE